MLFKVTTSKETQRADEKGLEDGNTDNFKIKS